MANEKLRYQITADSSGFVKGANKASMAAGQLNTKTKRSSMAFQQLAYALDDAQLGQVKFSQSMRGMQNNIQALAVSAGAGGPLVLAITAATAAVGFFVKKWEESETAATSAIDKIEEKLIGLRKSLGIATTENELHEFIKLQAEKRKVLEKELARLEKGTTVRKQMPGGGYFDSVVFDFEAIKKVKDKIRQHDKLHQRDLGRIRQKASAEQNRLDAEARKRRYKRELAEEKEHAKNLAKARRDGMGQADPNTGSLFSQESISRHGFEDWKKSKSKSNPKSGLTGELWGDPYTHSWLNDTKSGFDELGDSINTTAIAATLFSSALSGMNSGDFNSVAKSMIDTAKQLAFSMAITAATKDSVKFGAVALPLLIGGALAAVSSSFGKVGVSGGGAGRGSAAQRVGNFTPTATLSRSNTNGATRIIGELMLRGQNQVVSLQAANETRQTF